MSKKVVVIGGSYAGTAVAQKLDGKLDVTIVERSKVFHHNIASLRAFGGTDESFLWQQFLPYEKTLKNGKIVHGNVVGIEDGVVKVEDGDDLPYDYLVVATGSHNPFTKFAKLDSAQEGIKEHQELKDKIVAAKSVCIVGGGPVGIELAGEIKAAYSDKDVTLIHRRDALLSNQGGGAALPDLFRQKVLEAAQGVGIRVILGDELDGVERGDDVEVGEKAAKTKKGEDVNFDLLLWCTGNKVNSDAFKDLLQDSMEDNGLLKVLPTLQVENQSKIFAVGDVTNVAEPKLMYTATEMHSKVVAANIIALSKGKGANKEHKPFVGTSFMVVGPDVGLSQLGFLPAFLGQTKTSGMFAKIKNKERLFTTKQWKIHATKMPQTNPYA